MKTAFAILFSMLLLSACQTTQTTTAGDAVSMDAAKTVSTKNEILAMGGRELDEADFRSEIVGKTLDEGSWTWTILPDGTASSRGDDGSWSNTSTWDWTDGQYCRQSEGNPRACSAVYELAGVYRFGGSDGTLNDWSVVVQ